MKTFISCSCFVVLTLCSWGAAVSQINAHPDSQINAHPVSQINAQNQAQAFAIQVVDEVTGRGVPLVELETINHMKFVTDSHGRAAISDPDLMGQNVYFTIRSHGYEYKKDGFGFRGKAVRIEPGANATLRVQRINLAERLYRATGGGIYADSVRLDEDVPIDQPLLHAQVVGCDSVMTALYRGKIHWFWGDTSRLHYPIGGNFHMSGATSSLPQDGGLSPEAGVQFDYFVGESGAVRPMAEMPGDGPTWLSAVTVLQDQTGKDQMYAGYIKVRNLLEPYQWGFVVWNDDTERFEHLSSTDQRPALFLDPQTHTCLQKDGDQEYVYFMNPLPLTRVVADPAAFVDPDRYEGFTCLKTGTRPEDRQLDRDTDGQLRYSWKPGMPGLSQKDQAMLVDADVMAPEERLVALQDLQSGRAVLAHSGSVYWNEYRKRWILITVELNGESSLLGEVWFAEADALTGPWKYARKIVTHEKYSFYNPKQHPFFDQQKGRIIYFEGTYTHTFSGNSDPTPRYDYNQMMYRLDLSIAALNLPVPFSMLQPSEDSPPVASGKAGPVAFFALERPSENTVAVAWNGNALHVLTETDVTVPALFHAYPSDIQNPLATTTPLYEFVHTESGDRMYSTQPDGAKPGFRRTSSPICRVWK